MYEPIFDASEYAGRLAKVRNAMAERGLDLCLVSSPENIFYLTGLDHWGYFTPHLLIVPAEGELTLVTRAMEAVTIGHQVHNARFVGHSDSESIALKAWDCMREFASPRIGIECWSAGFPDGLGQALRAASAAQWVDFSYVIDDIRLVKSPAELNYMRSAARVSDAMMQAAIDAIGAGVSERHVAAQCSSAMIEAGGTYPGFGPFVRPGSRLGEEHTTWGNGTIKNEDTIFLELSGCVHRYHAPMGRLVHVGGAPQEAQTMAAVAKEAFSAVVQALRPGVLARDVYAEWQGVVDGAGLEHYRRHHCGYLVGIGCAPSWTGGNRVVGLRHDSALVIEEGMTFHILSWLMGTGRGDFFISNTVMLSSAGAEVLSGITMDPIER
ncbi:M24 family metallopeptidase [Burkholderia sp. 8Y]|uniref:M24 family metallopeptidase n=1 Tax=Burkholderia sp. 8Y TaxID=2653133 RepID=UPI001356A452|nr:Xaa-Pro peptidase family protein [Burkholderia sp. 8Y]